MLGWLDYTSTTPRNRDRKRSEDLDLYTLYERTRTATRNLNSEQDFKLRATLCANTH